MHLFLTGDKRIGKTTVVNAIAAAFPGRLGGFSTVRLNTFLPGQHTVHLFGLQENQEPTEENLLFVCGRNDTDTVERFAQLGCRALRQSVGAELLIMDELGPHEAEAAVFQEAVLTVLDGKIPVLGVLQKADAPFLAQIARHPQVMLLEVTEENREELVQRISEYMDLLRKG